MIVKKKRVGRRNFCYSDALYCLNRDHLGSVPKINMKEFESFFRISKPRFHNMLVSDRVMGDVNALYDPAFNVIEDLATKNNHNMVPNEAQNEIENGIGNGIGNGTTGLCLQNDANKILISNEWDIQKIRKKTKGYIRQSTM